MRLSDNISHSHDVEHSTHRAASDNTSSFWSFLTALLLKNLTTPDFAFIRRRSATTAAAAPAPAVVGAGDTAINAPMPGKIVKLVAEAGKAVKKGDVVLILEAMKMQNEISAPADGTLKSINVAAGQSVKPGEVLAVIG